MKRYYKEYPVLATGMLVLLALLIFSNFFADSRVVKPLTAKDGIMDLSGWDFSRTGIVTLNGEWEFYWDQLLTPQDFTAFGSAEKPRLTGYIKVPFPWKGELGDARLSNKGFGTYRLLVKLKPTDMIFGLKTESIRSSHRLYVNGSFRGQGGTPSRDWVGYSPRNVPYMTFFNVTGDQAEILVQVANHDYSSGGIALPLSFGSQTAIVSMENQVSRFEMIIFAAMFTLGIYHLGVFLCHLQNRSFLLFGLYCLLTGILEISYDQKLLYQFFPETNYYLLYKIKTLCHSFSMICITLFLSNVAKEILPRKRAEIILLIYGAYALFVFLTPIDYYALVENYFMFLQILIYLYFIAILLRSLLIKEDESISPLEIQTLIIAFACLVIAYIDAFMYLYFLKDNRVVWIFGVTVWVFAISFMLAIRFHNAYHTVQNMSAQLLELDKTKDDFLVNTSHEIKTPLHGIINISQSMLEGADGDLTSQQSRNLRLIVTISRRLSRLTNDILDVAKLKNSEIPLDPVNIDCYSAVNAFLEVFRQVVKGREIKLVNAMSPDTPLVWADESRATQVLYNLIGNAVKFTKKGQIIISAETRGNMLHISVQDSGIGISAQEQERIFDPYVQVSKGIDREFSGTGIGLTIASRLSALMGGRLWLDWSLPGEGTKITFSLPLSLTTESPEAFELSPEMAALSDPLLLSAKNIDVQPAGDQRFTILAVDDEIINLQVIINVFALENINILIAASGEEALLLLQDKQPIDLVLLDIMMPKMSGYEVCRKIRQTRSLFELPVILLTVRNNVEDIEIGFDAGASDFLSKPFSGRELRARVKNLLALKTEAQSAIRYEMAFLQAQIKPHFFYNVLNTIIAFCYTDSAKAGKLLSEFSNYLRRSFDVHADSAFISIENELELIRSYVEIEKARFGPRLKVVYDIDDALLQYYLPPLTVQPLVENAIRHGLLKKVEGGEITLRMHSIKTDIMIEVADNGVGMDEEQITDLLTPTKCRKGVGLFNINVRLNKLFGNKLVIESRVNLGTTVFMKIPVILHPK